MVLSQMVFPSEETAEKSMLYYRGKAKPCVHDGLGLLPGVPVRFDTYFFLTQEFGCPLYDPQISTRFDSWTEV